MAPDPSVGRVGEVGDVGDGSTGAAAGDGESVGKDGDGVVEMSSRLEVAGGLPSAAAGGAAAAPATISGTFRYDTSTGFAPGRQLTVKLIHDNGVRGPGADPNTKGNLDTVIDTTTTDDAGEFTFTFDPSSTGLGKNARVYLMVVAKNDAAIVTNTAVRIRHGYASNSWWLNPGDTITPTVRPNSAVKNGAFHAADAALTAYRFTEEEAGWTRDRVRIQYPQTSQAKYISIAGFKHISLPKKSNDDWDNETVYHEYGHAVMGELFGGSWRIPHVRTYLNFNQGFFPCHARAADTGRFYAWSEGFAEFFATATAQWSDHDRTDGYRLSLERGRPTDPANSSFTDDPWFNNGYTSSDCLDGGKGDGFDGNEVEGALASILWDVYDGENEPYDEMNASMRDILGTISKDEITVSPSKRNNAKARTGHEFWKYFRTNRNHDALRKIYYMHGIQKPDRFEPNDKAGAATKLVPNTSVDAQFQNHFLTDSIPSGTVPNVAVGTDVDYYTFTVEEEQRVNVTVHTGRWGGLTDVSATFGVTGPSGMTPHVVQLGSNATVTFTANESGTHNLSVRGTQNRKYTGWYTLSLNATPQVPQQYEENDRRTEAPNLVMAKLNAFQNVSRLTASTARNDPDYYAIHLRNGHRIQHARILNGPGLDLTLVNDSDVVATASNGTVLNTTTEPEGDHYFVVDGDARVTGYTLNVTTQLISQRYEENDNKASATDLNPDLGLNTPPQPRNSKRGGNTWCSKTKRGGSIAGGQGTGPSRLFTICPRHKWQDEGTAGAGYGPHEDDWYYITLRKDERVNVSIGDDRLGVELYHGGTKVAERSARDPQQHVIYHARSAGKYFLRTTGDEYVPSHRIRIERFIPQAQDRFEPNDERATAARVNPGSGGTQTKEFPLLKLAGNDDDYFAVDLDSGDALNATLTHLDTEGTVSLSIVEPGGSVTNATVVSGPVNPNLKGGMKYRAETEAKSTGTYYVHVSGSRDVALKYNLTIVTTTVNRSSSRVFPPPDGADRVEFDGLETGQWSIRDVPTPEEIARAIWIESIGLNPDVPVDGFETMVDIRETPPDGVAPLDGSIGVEGSEYVVVRHEGGYDGAVRVRVGVDRSVIASADASVDRLAVYRHPGRAEGGEWRELDTVVAEEGDERVVLEGESDGLSVYTIGVTARASIADLVAEHKPLYNRYLGRVPGVFRSLFANERINAKITTRKNEVQTVGVVMDGQEIGTVEQGGIEDPSLVVRASGGTIRDVIAADDPAEEAKAALDDGRITYHGVGPVNALKVTVVKVTVGVLRFVGDTFGVGPFK